jgi:hypothetical protein
MRRFNPNILVFKLIRLYEINSMFHLNSSVSLQRVRTLISSAEYCPIDICNIFSVKSLKNFPSRNNQKVDVLRELDGSLYIIKSNCETSEISATLRACQIGIAPRTWKLGPDSFLQDFVSFTPLGGLWWPKCSAKLFGKSVAETLIGLHSAGIFYIDNICRHLFWRKDGHWILIDYGTALLIDDPDGPKAEVELWLRENQDSRAKAIAKNSELDRMAKLHDWFVWRGELTKANSRLFWCLDKNVVLASFESTYPCP